MQLIGLDVGLSETRATSGLAILDGSSISLHRTTALANSRVLPLPSGFAADFVAIDAPLLPEGHTGVRVCEQIFSRGAFQRRCKPGFSHVRGTGLQLREAGDIAIRQFAAYMLTRGSVCRAPQVRTRHSVVEAFPNAFLGVCVAEDAYGQMPQLKRGRKFDWLYDTWLERDTFAAVHERVSDVLPPRFVELCHKTNDHEKRAALICLLTAACVARGRYTAVGEPAGGYFFLPPQHLWSHWAKQELERVRNASSVRVHESIEPTAMV